MNKAAANPEKSPGATVVFEKIIPQQSGGLSPASPLHSAKTSSAREAAASPPLHRASTVASNFAKASSGFQKAMADTVKIQFQGFL